jgi:hypothetical protein
MLLMVFRSSNQRMTYNLCYENINRVTMILNGAYQVIVMFKMYTMFVIIISLVEISHLRWLIDKSIPMPIRYSQVHIQSHFVRSMKGSCAMG